MNYRDEEFYLPDPGLRKLHELPPDLIIVEVSIFFSKFGPYSFFSRVSFQFVIIACIASAKYLIYHPATGTAKWFLLENNGYGTAIFSAVVTGVIIFSRAGTGFRVAHFNLQFGSAKV